jgi:hypothetical protein
VATHASTRLSPRSRQKNGKTQPGCSTERTLPAGMFCKILLPAAGLPLRNTSRYVTTATSGRGDVGFRKASPRRSRQCRGVERLLSTPGGATMPDFPYSITLAEPRLRWEWDPLRSNARFQRILRAGTEDGLLVEIMNSENLFAELKPCNLRCDRGRIVEPVP